MRDTINKKEQAYRSDKHDLDRCSDSTCGAASKDDSGSVDVRTDFETYAILMLELMYLVVPPLAIVWLSAAWNLGVLTWISIFAWCCPAVMIGYILWKERDFNAMEMMLKPQSVDNEEALEYYSEKYRKNKKREAPT
jgi:hypothetical protein